MRRTLGKLFAKSLVIISFVVWPVVAQASSNSVTTATDKTLPSALCQIVYPVDQFPSQRGYSYIFYGNAFFINDQGYVLTAAHVVSNFRNGGPEPHILVGPSQGPRRIFDASLVSADWEHDVALLKATPNPFESNSKLTYLSLSDESVAKGQAVVSASFRPPDVEDAYSQDRPIEDFARSEVLDYQFHWEKGARSELLLISQQVVPGQSGSPLISADSSGAVGIVVGQWLHPAVVPSAASGKNVTLEAGAALRIHYAINLLQQQHVAWHSASESESTPAENSAKQDKGFVPPAPLSVVATPYPPQALYGGEVVLDALIDTDGKLADLTVVHGNDPFVEPVLRAVRTWTFSPARLDGNAVEGRIGIVFQFPQSFLIPITPPERKYDEPLPNAADRGALPVRTVEPGYPVDSTAEGSVAVYAPIDPNGKVTSTNVLMDVPSLTASTIAALHDWRFAPGRRADANADSAAVIVVTFRRPAVR